MNEQLYSINDIEELKRAEWKRRDTLGRATCVTASVLLILFGIKDAISGEITLALIVTAYSFFNTVVFFAYKKFQNLDLFCNYLVFSSASLLLYLVATGGSGNSGIIWLSAFPILMYSILTVKSATYLNIGAFSLILYIIFFPENPFYSANYTSHIKAAGLGSYTLTAFFTYFQARAREAAAESVAHLNVELRHIASTDELTDLPNRRDMALRLEFENKRAKRSSRHFSIILCDIDYFKKINDSFGHSVGDQALQAFSLLLTSRFRETDKVGRWGGEEFLVILPNTDINKAISIANEVRQSICQASLIPNLPNRLVTMSAGVASSSQTDDIGDLLKIADNNLYEAKDSGRNCVRPK